MDIVIGLDLGQASDYSALALLERSLCQVEVNRPNERARLETQAFFGCRALKRWPLGTPYPTIVKEVTKLLGQPALEDAALVIDATGVGRPVVDMFRQAPLAVPLIPVMITGGNFESYYQDDGIFRVAKIVLISTLQVLLQQRRLQFSQRLPLVSILVKELENYRVKISAALNETFQAREGAHDDLLLALALAAWQGERTFLPGSTEIVSIPTDYSQGNRANPFRRHEDRRCGLLRRRRSNLGVRWLNVPR